MTPKSDFQTYQPDASEELAKQKNQRWFKVSLSYALAALAANESATSEQLSGARNFIRLLEGLSEREEKVAKFPKLQLETYDPKRETKTL